MVSTQKVEHGVSMFLDNELMPNLPSGGVQKLVAGVGISLLLKKSEAAVMKLKDNPIVKMMEIIDNNGNIDIDAIRVELKKKIEESGIKIDVPMIGMMTFHKDDVDKLYDYIMES